MDDIQIIELYFKRDEAAISETAAKYGALCHSIALNVLSNNADAEECVNDTYLLAWNSIPPLRPNKLGAWLGRVIRNIAINLWNKNHRKKRYDGLYAYTPGGQSTRLLGTYWYDTWSANEYGVYYKRGRSLYVLPHETGKSQKLYTLSRSDGTHISFTVLGDGKIALTIYNKYAEIHRDILLDGITGEVRGTLTEPTPYSETFYTYAQSVFTAGDRTIHLVGDKFSTTDMRENGVSILPDGFSISRYPVHLGDNLVFRGYDTNNPYSYPIIIIRTDGDDTFLSPNQYINRIQGGTTDGSYLFYIRDNNTVMCMDAYSGEEWELTADAESSFLDLSTDGEYLYTCAPWNDIQTCWIIVYAEDDRPIELQLVEENITE